MNDHLQGSAEWLEMRRSHIGASDAPIIMGVSPWRTPLQLWKEKRGLLMEDRETFAMSRGKALEAEALQAFEVDTGLMMIPGGVYYHPEHPVLMCSLDGMSVLGETAVEIKCPGAKDHQLALSGRVPDHYYPQLQHQMAVLGHQHIWYYSYDGTSGKAVRVLRDDAYIVDMIARELAFWELVVSGVEPAATIKDFLQRSDDAWIALETRLADIQARRDLLDAEEDAVKVLLLESAGGFPCRGPRLTLSSATVAGRVDYKAVPELHGVDLEKYRKPGTTSWRFTLKKETP